MFKVNKERSPAKSASTLWIQALSFSDSDASTRARLSLVRRLHRSSHICEEIEIQAMVNQEDTGQRKGKCQESYPKKRGGSKMPQLRPEF